MSRILKLIDIVSIIGFFACLVCGSFVIFLTHFSVKRNFGPYKWLITAFASSGIIFAGIDSVSTPILHHYNSGMVFFTVKKPLGASEWVMKCFLAAYCGLFSVTVTFLAVQFIYRYYAIFSPCKLIHFKNFKLFIWISYPLIVGLIWALSAYHFGAADNFSDRYLENGIYEFYGENLTTLPHIAAVALNDTDPDHTKINWRNCYYIIVVAILLSIQYAIIIFCGYYMNSEVKSKTAGVSKTLHRFHQQFYRALMLQITVPTINLFIPMVFLFAVPFLQSEISFPTCIIVSFFSFYPAADALILIYVVSDYSRVVKKYATCFVSYIRIRKQKLAVQT